MSNKIMVDTSVLVEYVKGDKDLLFTSITTDDAIDRYINETVVSEFLFQQLKINSGKAPKTVQAGGKVADFIEMKHTNTMLKLFQFLPTDSQLFSLVPTFMQQYNLLPNDAIILATCKIHGITQLATHDSDFDVAAPAEGIQLLKEGSI